MVEPATDNLATLATKPPRHRWFERTPLPVFDAKTGCERHDRVCEFCKITRTTVIPPRGLVWIEWLTDDGVKTINGKTPPCVLRESKCL